ncbi:hypothetical protein [Companilactobacillus baiquanensis]|uniref:ABC transporter permease n=1 Tax=Companilactobacillus baiquanensis TaxID=2486005 RepID=A0ABW1US57_9LACO|nr:hypothetical protein [Companilactobacillus baiquanensis]
MKIKFLVDNFLKLIFRDYLYLSLLFILLVIKFTIDSALGLSNLQKTEIFIILTFIIGLISGLNFFRNDQLYNRYVKQKINNYWLYISVQTVILLLMNILTAVLTFINTADWVLIILFTTSGFVGTEIAMILKLRFEKHPIIGQIGILILLYLSLSDSSSGTLYYVNWILPPISKMIVTLQDGHSLQALLPIAGQQFVYGIILFAISGVFYQKKFEK